MSQLLGLLLLALGIALQLRAAWPLMVAGFLLMLVPEITATVRRGDAAAKRRRAAR